MSNTFTSTKVRQIFSFVIHLVFTPQPLMAVGVLFSPMISGWSGGRASGRAFGRVAGNSLSGPVFTNMDQAERKISSRSDQDQGQWLS